MYTELVFLFFTNNDQYAREASLQKSVMSARKKKKEHNGQSTLNVRVRGRGKQEGKADRKNCTKTKNLKQNVFIITQGDVWRVQ